MALELFYIQIEVLFSKFCPFVFISLLNLRLVFMRHFLQQDDVCGLIKIDFFKDQLLEGFDFVLDVHLQLPNVVGIIRRRLVHIFV